LIDADQRTGRYGPPNADLPVFAGGLELKEISTRELERIAVATSLVNGGRGEGNDGPGFAALLEQLLFRGEFSPVFVGHLIVVLLAAKALSAHGLAAPPWRFYRNKPAWSGVVQVAMLLLTLLLVTTSSDGRVQRELSRGGVAHCVHSVNGEFVPLEAAACEELRLSGLRTAMALWATLSWIGVNQFALAGGRGPR